MTVSANICGLIGLTDMVLDIQRATPNPDMVEIPARATTPIDTICPACGSQMHGLGARKCRVRTWPVNANEPICYITISRKRYLCPKCGKTVIQPMPSCIDEGHRMTKGFVEAIAKQAVELPFKSIQKTLKVNDATVKRIFVEYAKSIVDKYDFALPTIMGLDEVMTDKTFRTTITNLERGCLFDILEYRQQPFLEKEFEKYPLEQREKVKWVCTDMYRPFKKPIAELLPNARWVIDRFHVVMKANEAVDQMRIRLQSKLPKTTALNVKKRFRFSLLRRPQNLNQDEKNTLDLLRASCQDLMKGYDLKEGFYAIYEQSFTRDEARLKFQEWKSRIPHETAEDKENFKEFFALVKTFENFEDNILNFFDSGGLTNGLTECMNGLIKITNRLGRGYEFDVLRLKMLCRSQPIADSMSRGVQYGANVSTLAQSVGVNDSYEEDSMMMKSINMDYEKRRQGMLDKDDAFGTIDLLEDELTG